MFLKTGYQACGYFPFHKPNLERQGYNDYKILIICTLADI